MRDELTKIQIESAFKNAKQDLSSQEYSWILDSSLTERAYLLGIFNTLNYLGDTSAISGEIVLALSNTLFSKRVETK
jgi:translation elongation factor EF-1alpha